MPGIADLQPAQIQASSVGALDSQPDVNVSSLGHLPEFQDFMNAYKSGVITAEDIKRRQIVGTSGYEAEAAQNLAAKSGAEQANIDINEVRPLQRELAKAQTTGGTEQQTLLNQLNSPDPSVSLPAQEAFVKRARQKEAILVFGTATPKLEVDAGVKPPEFDGWVTQQVNNYLPGVHTPEADKARAVYETNLRMAGEKGQEYTLAKEAAKNTKRELTPGTPEYDAQLRHVLSEKLTHEKLQEIQFETLKEFGKAQAKAAGEAPERAQKEFGQANEAIAKIAANDPVKELDKARPQYQQLLLTEQKVNSRTPEQWRSDPNAARALDLHLAFNYFKMLHPDTRVTESNFKELNHLSPVDVGGAEIADQLNIILRGSYLDPTGRQRIIDETKRAYQGYVNAARPVVAGYREHAARQGINPDSISHPWNYLFTEPDATATKPAAATATPLQAPRPSIEQRDNAPTFPSLAAVPSSVQFFKGTDGQLRVNPNFRP